MYGTAPHTDREGRLRADYQELDPDVQARVQHLWHQVNSDTLYEFTDFVGYKREFLRLFGFELDGIDYEADVNPAVQIRDVVQV